MGAAIGPSMFAATLGKGAIVSKSTWLLFMLIGTVLACACARVTSIPGEDGSHDRPAGTVIVEEEEEALLTGSSMAESSQ